MEISGIGSSAYADYLQEQNISETKLKDQINNIRLCDSNGG